MMHEADLCQPNQISRSAVPPCPSNALAASPQTDPAQRPERELNFENPLPYVLE